MKSIPAELRTDFRFETTQFGDVRRPVAGSMDEVFVEYRVHREYSPALSKLAGEEVQTEKEILLVQTDKFSRVPLAVGTPDGKVACEIDPDIKLRTAELYERFKGRQGSKDTMVSEWEAVNDAEKTLLFNMGCFTVEQLNSTPKSELYRFGSAGPELWERSERHLNSKRKNDPEEVRKEMALVLQEKERLARRNEEREREYLEMQKRLAELEGKGGAEKSASRSRSKSVGKRPENSLEAEQMKSAS